MPTTLSKTPRAPRAPALSPNEERPENCIARRCLAAVAHACHAIGAGCGWLRCLANAPHHPEGRHKLLEDECRYALATQGRGGRLPSAPLRSAPVKQLPREADHARRILCK